MPGSLRARTSSSSIVSAPPLSPTPTPFTHLCLTFFSRLSMSDFSPCLTRDKSETEIVIPNVLRQVSCHNRTTGRPRFHPPPKYKCFPNLHQEVLRESEGALRRLEPLVAANGALDDAPPAEHLWKENGPRR